MLITDLLPTQSFTTSSNCLKQMLPLEQFCLGNQRRTGLIYEEVATGLFEWLHSSSRSLILYRSSTASSLLLNTPTFSLIVVSNNGPNTYQLVLNSLQISIVLFTQLATSNILKQMELLKGLPNKNDHPYLASRSTLSQNGYSLVVTITWSAS